ncbi:MAG: DUF2844 domain-containing protein [Thermodesulfovibrionales bacterium]|jgi:hypothetical protein
MKRRTLYALWLALGFLAAFQAAASRVEATLGESVESVDADRKALSGARGAATSRTGYSVREIESGSVIVREYVSPSGVVFGIAWNGLTHPDLTQLLGSYAGEYREALQRTPRGPDRRRLRVKTEQIVVEKWGHMRNLEGRAYAPALIPPGVRIDEIR